MGVVFVAGNLALDFVGTLNERDSHRVEQLRSPADLSRWLGDAGVVDAAPPCTARQFEEGIGLREALFAVIRPLIDDRAIPQAPLEVVNTVAARPPAAVHVTRTGRLVRSGDVDAALSSVARDGLLLFDRRDDAVLKWCADPSCTHPFLDHSRGHRRRWCDMNACGGRAKAAAYRRRQHA